METLNIQPVIVGHLTYVNQFGYRQEPPKEIYFSTFPEEPFGEGAAFAVTYSEIYGTFLCPVLKNDGSRLIIPGYAGLTCDYDPQNGVLKNFRNESEEE